MWTGGRGGQKRDFFVDVINGWPLYKMLLVCDCDSSCCTQQGCVAWNRPLYLSVNRALLTRQVGQLFFLTYYPVPVASIWFEIWGSWIRVKKILIFQANFR